MGTNEGGCRCRDVRYAIEGEPLYVTICHCDDCRRSSGAPYVAWAGVKRDSFAVIRGKAKHWTMDGKSIRYFCAQCGTGLYHLNEERQPDLIDVQVATLDEPDQWAPRLQMQVAEKLKWIDEAVTSTVYQRYPEFPIDPEARKR